jgi:hypothetical protein
LIPVTGSVLFLVGNAALSGYPAFPISALALDVDWAVPLEQVQGQARAIANWARAPGAGGEELLESGLWVVPWLERVFTSQVVLLLAIVGLSAALAAFACRHASCARCRLGAADATARRILLALSAATVVLWLVSAPDIRFGWGVLTLLTATFVSPVSAAVRLGRVDLPPITTLPISAVSVAILFGAVSFGAVSPVSATGSGPLGAESAPVVPTRTVPLPTGLTIQVPVEGDQCWRTAVCTPYPSEALRLRGSDFTAGFSQVPMPTQNTD